MLAHIPPWVFVVFVLLLTLGIWQSRTRGTSPAAPALVAAAMFLLSLYGVVGTFGLQVFALAVWAVGIAIAPALGRRAFGPHAMVRVAGSSKIEIAGSWLPLALMMGIFLAKFIVGFATGVRAPIVSRPWFPVAASLVFGLLSGGFVARAVAVGRFAGQGSGDSYVNRP